MIVYAPLSEQLVVHCNDVTAITLTEYHVKKHKEPQMEYIRTGCTGQEPIL